MKCVPKKDLPRVLKALARAKQLSKQKTCHDCGKPLANNNKNRICQDCQKEWLAITSSVKKRKVN
jgi:NMD protein affecting ribosome stability and mRNA decay